MSAPPTSGRETPGRSTASNALQALQDEIAVSSNYGTTPDGRKRRKLTREQSKKQTLQRKQLEKKDAQELAVLRANEESGNDRAGDLSQKPKRLRGKNVALEDSVVQGSLIFGSSMNAVTTTTTTTTTTGAALATKKSVTWEDQQEAIEKELENFTDPEQEEDIADIMEEDEDSNLEEEEEEEEADGDEEDDDSDAPMESSTQKNTTPPTPRAKPSPGNKATTQRKRTHVQKSVQVSTERTEQMKAAASGQYKGRRMYRLTNFKSHRMALRHGDALGAHARGLNKTAIGRLREVAASVPMAPQVYSSLGLVYENILLEDAHHKKERFETRAPTTTAASTTTTADVTVEELSSLRHRIDIATKAYGSYHVAALLCRKDFTLWLRAGDMALGLAELHSIAFTLLMKASSLQTPSPNSSHPTEMEFHRLEKTKWLQEARDDYQIADNSRPPGITVPAKLAFAQMHLGNYSEALAILTDLKNQAQTKSETIRTNPSNIDDQGHTGLIERSELERSYTAWMLYADLMLRIGFECTQWNRGIFTNENNAFRRWLKKYSKSFDWKERRLQALCLAFEAAAGSASGRKVVQWVKERASKMVPSSPATAPQDVRGMWFADTYENSDKPSANDEEQDDPVVETQDKDLPNKESESATLIPVDEAVDTPKDVEKPNRNNEPSSTSTAVSSSFHEERQRLIESNRKELADFDLETSNMMHSTDQGLSSGRQAARASLIRKHKEMVLKLVGDFQAKKILETSRDDDIIPLPMSASYATVCNIAYQLLKLCLTMDLYDGGKLVAEATAKYVRERITRRSARLESLKEYRTRLSSMNASPFNVNTETYDDLDGSSDSSENGENYLSDDDVFDNASEDMLSTSLPPHHQVLYGLSLVGMHSYAFLAQKLLCSLETVPDNNTTYSAQDRLDTNLLSDHAWITFNHDMAQPLNKMDLFAFVSSIIKKLDMEKEWTQHLSALYQRYLSDYEQKSLTSESGASYHAAQLNKSEYLTALLSYFRMEYFRAQIILSSPHPSDDGQRQIEALNILHVVLSKICRLKEILLKRPESNAILGPVAVEAMKVISEIFDLAVCGLKRSSQTSDTHLEFIRQMFLLTSWLCQVPISVHSDKVPSSKLTNAVEGLPFPHDWQSNSHKAISRLVHNLCASCSVSAFSGWEREEFQLPLLKYRSEASFFGVTLSDSRVAGILDDEIEKRLALQWIEIEHIFPTASFNFSDSLSIFQKSSWYMDTAVKRHNAFKGKTIDLFGEKDALSILSSFADLCLYLAKISSTTDEDADHLLKYSLSIILPMTQFGLNQTVWTSDIGVKANDQDADDWQNFLPRHMFRAGAIGNLENEGTTTAIILSKPKLSRPSRPSNQNNETKRSTLTKAQGLNEEESPLDSLVEVQIDWLQSEWIKASTTSTTEINAVSIQDSITKMNELDAALAKLKTCATVISIQKTALSVAVALLDVAACHHSYNPFLCLHHAAIFASQGSKGGNNDDFFKRPLPPQSQCTPRDALGILGRADCLRAIHFSDEAMFLCSYVAGVLSLHRSMGGNRMMTSSDWKAVGIHMYTCAIALDDSIYSLMDVDTRNKALDSWEQDAQEEIKAARKDARSIRKDYLPISSEQDAQDEIDDLAMNASTLRRKNRSSILSTQLVPAPYTTPLFDSSWNRVSMDTTYAPPLGLNYALPLITNYLPPSAPNYELMDDIEMVAL